MKVIKDETNKIILMVDGSSYLMSIRGNKIIFNIEKEENNNIFLRVIFLDNVLAKDFYLCVDFLVKGCLPEKDIYLMGFNYPQHVKILIENGFSVTDKYLFMQSPVIKEKERG